MLISCTCRTFLYNKPATKQGNRSVDCVISLVLEVACFDSCKIDCAGDQVGSALKHHSLTNNPSWVAVSKITHLQLIFSDPYSV